MAREPFATRLTCIWIGGFFFWMLKGFKGEISGELIVGKESRNMWVGYLLTITTLILFVYFVFIRPAQG